MCFSADASLLGAAVIGGIGAYGLTQVRGPRQLAWAALPLAFAAHQLVEGMTWIELEGRPGATWAGWSVRIWALYAWALLPVWIPAAVLLLEPEPRRRRWLWGFLVLGAIDAAGMLYLALHPDLEVRLVGGTLDYVLPWGDALWLGLPYVVITCGAVLVSSRHWVRVFGAANLVAMSFAAAVARQGFSSVWCALAAGLSVIVVVELRAEAMARDPGDAGDRALGPLG